MNTSGMGYKILDERYALLECLAVSGVGEIYRGRDLNLTQTENTPSRILLHLLPSNASLAAINLQTQQAQALAETLGKPWILPILAQGQTNGRAYFVLSSPEALGAQSVMSLPSQQLPTSNKLTGQFGSSVKAKQLPKVIDSAFLVTLPNQALYLLGTALIPAIHSLRAPHTGLALYRRSGLKPALVFSGIMAIALSTVAFEYRARPELLSTPTQPTYLSSPQALFAQAELSPTLQDNPKDPTALAIPVALQESIPATAPALLSLNSTEMNTPEPESLVKTAMLAEKAEPLEVIEAATNKTQEPLAAKPANKVVAIPKSIEPADKTTVSNKSLKSTAAKEASTLQQVVSANTTKNTPVAETIYRTASVEPTPPTQIKRTTTSRSQPLGFDELVERANKSLESRNFSAKNGVLFYTRQIKIRDHLHPQVERLGRFVVIYQHELARNMLKADEPIQAHSLLNSSKNLIQEFNLKNLNSAQEVLEHKFNQYN